MVINLYLNQSGKLARPMYALVQWILIGKLNNTRVFRGVLFFPYFSTHFCEYVRSIFVHVIVPIWRALNSFACFDKFSLADKKIQPTHLYHINQYLKAIENHVKRKF